LQWLDAVTDTGLRFDESVSVEEIRIEAPELSGTDADQYVVIDEHITYRLAQHPSSYVVLNLFMKPFYAVYYKAKYWPWMRPR